MTTPTEIIPEAPVPTPAPATTGTTFRALRREELPEAAAMFARVMELPGPGRVADVAGFFERAFFDTPWADPEIVPLVAEDAQGALIGMIGAESRRLRFEGRTLRVASAGFLAVVPEARQSATGVLLLRRLLGGSQDLTVTDTASEIVERIWLRLGGSHVELKGVHWVQVSRPWAIGAGLAAGAAGRGGPGRPAGALRVAASLLDEVTARVGRRLLTPAAPDVRVEPLTPQLMLEHGPALADPGRPAPPYDEPFLRWLFDRTDGVAARGRLVAHLVRGSRGRVLGWYVYLLRPGWRSEVLQVRAAPRDLGTVVDALLAHAHASGSAALRGRMEPGLPPVIARRRCLLAHRGGALIHGRDRDLARRVGEEALLTRLDTDWFSDALI